MLPATHLVSLTTEKKLPVEYQLVNLLVPCAWQSLERAAGKKPLSLFPAGMSRSDCSSKSTGTVLQMKSLEFRADVC
jgi:hypothetical protein